MDNVITVEQSHFNLYLKLALRGEVGERLQRLTKHIAMKAYWGSSGIVSLIL
jgi:hypothetical protein